MAARKPPGTTAGSCRVPSCATWAVGICCSLAWGCLNPLPEEVPSNQAPEAPGSPVFVNPADPGPAVEGPPASSSPDLGASEPSRDCEPDAGTSGCGDDVGSSMCSPCDGGRDAQP
jgi:hypothetical protein